MPHFIDFLLAPWKLFSLIFGSAPSLPKAGTPTLPVSAVPAVSSGCSYTDVGGQVLHTCRIMGYEMPFFVFIASLIIISIFVFASVALIAQSGRVVRALDWVGKQLKKVKSERGDLTAIRAIMTKESFTAHAWRMFEETLLASPAGDEAFATQSVESAFSKSLLVEENIQSALFNAIPGVLTGLGLLMTFVAILDGLSHVTVSANMDVQGISGLINGLSGKFVSSIVAVTCAVLFVFIERFAYGRTDQAYRKLLNNLAPRFRRRTTEHLLFHIQSQLITQGAFQRELAQTLTKMQEKGKPPVSSAPPSSPSSRSS